MRLLLCAMRRPDALLAAGFVLTTAVSLARFLAPLICRDHNARAKRGREPAAATGRQPRRRG